MKRAVILTGHFPRQKRRGSMLWVSEHLQDMGWHVTHVTVGYSHFSVLKKDARLAALGYRPRRGVHCESPSLTSIYALSPIHPFKTRYSILNNVLSLFMRLFVHKWRKFLRTPLRTADLVICESGASVLLARMVAELAPRTARIYRVNDDIRLLNAPDYLVRAEQKNARYFTRISTASPHLAARFSAHPRVTLDPMGIPRHRLAASLSNPYTSDYKEKIAVCAGTTQIDIAAVERIAHQRPNWQIHVLGRVKATPPALSNVIWHGEQDFDLTLRYIAHADIGLAPYVDAQDVIYQTTNSNRILLYRHFGLPILGPDRLCHPDAPSVIGYSAPDALERCECYGRQPEAIPDWSQLARSLSQNGVTDPPNDVSTVPETILKPRVKTVPALASNA